MTTPNGEVNFTITDGALAAISAPSGAVQAKIGCASSGVDFQALTTTQIDALVASFAGGPLVEASALECQAGAEVIAVKVPTTTPGKVYGSDVAAVDVTDATNATPIVIDAVAHGLATGDVATIAGVGGNTAANGTFKITKVDADHFSLDGSVGNGDYTSGGTVQATGVHAPGTGTSVPTVTGAATDRFDVWMNTIAASAGIGTSGNIVQISLDAGRTYGPPIALGVAVVYAMNGTGMTLHFAAGTLIAGSTIKFTTVPPKWSAADVTTAILATLQGGTDDWGAGIHIVGECSATNASAFGDNLETLFNQGRYTFAFLDVRDFSPLTDADEAAWMTSIESDYAGVSSKRVCAGAGFVNIQSPIKTTFAGAPVYRRPITWAAAKRAVSVPIQVLYGRVRDGSLPATTGPGTASLKGDGFIYHDERTTPGLGAARFMAARTRIGRPGTFVAFPFLMSPPGSDFTMVPFRQVIDAACSVCRGVLELYVEDTVRLYPLSDARAGRILEQDAHEIERAADVVLQSQLIGVGAVSDAFLTVNRTDNISSTEKLRGTVSVEALGYILEIDISIGFAAAAFAA